MLKNAVRTGFVYRNSRGLKKEMSNIHRYFSRVEAYDRIVFSFFYIYSLRQCETTRNTVLGVHEILREVRRFHRPCSHLALCADLIPPGPGPSRSFLWKVRRWKGSPKHPDPVRLYPPQLGFPPEWPQAKTGTVRTTIHLSVLLY